MYSHLVLSAGLRLATGGGHGGHAGGSHVIVSLHLQLVGRPWQLGQRSGLGQRLELGAGQTACGRHMSISINSLLTLSELSEQSSATPFILKQSRKISQTWHGRGACIG